MTSKIAEWTRERVPNTSWKMTSLRFLINNLESRSIKKQVFKKLYVKYRTWKICGNHKENIIIFGYYHRAVCMAFWLQIKQKFYYKYIFYVDM